jgi:uncharacterized membrane protein YhhN
MAGWAGVAYGVYLTVLALRSPPGVPLTGHWMLQPAFKASMALLLAVAAFGHPVISERRWLMQALLLSAAGDFLLAIPWWTLSFGMGLAAFLFAHVCFLAVLVPLIPRSRPSAPRLAAVVLLGLAAFSLLAMLWPHLSPDSVTIPVIAYILVLTAMVCAAQLAWLPTIWTAVGAVCFAVSDTMIAIGRFILHNDALAVPIWWLYAAAQILIMAGFFFGRDEPEAYEDDGEIVDWPIEGFE